MGLVWLAFPGLIIWCGILLLPWRPWSTRETLEAAPGSGQDLSHVTVLIPARNEQDVIANTLHAVAAQGKNHRIVLIDDQCGDRTRHIAENLGIENLTVINGEPLPPGWSGKLWALEQGRAQVQSDVILLLDADIELKPGVMSALLAKMTNEKLHLVSLMASLRIQSPWEMLLMPAFIYFFKLLYPFRISNSTSNITAAAAGGCILIDQQILDDLGGFAALKSELIDDCALARRVKNRGGRTWIGLTHSVISRRRYDTLRSIWEMVSRTAFTQLRYSTSLLLLCTLLLIAAFCLPVIALFSQEPVTVGVSILDILLMVGSYLPTLKYYGMSGFWGFTLPITAMLYLLMTWSSAINRWYGTGAFWKDRTYTGQTG
ncbi:MAG: glycosyltransferase [Gammaproteobacteria bacterium]